MSMGQSTAQNVTSSGGWRGLGLLLILTLVVFWRGISGKFVTWDDEPLIYTNANITSPTLGGLAWHWEHPHTCLYIPLIYSAWWSIARMEMAVNGWGTPLDPAPFHLANLILHLGSIAIVFWLVRRIVGSGWAAVAGTAIFAVHPLQVEPVAWATGMKDVLGGFLSFAAIALYPWRVDRHEGTEARRHAGSEAGGGGAVLRDCGAGGGGAVLRDCGAGGGGAVLRNRGAGGAADGPSGWPWWAATTVFALALLAKPSAVVVPGIVLALECLIGRCAIKSAVARLWPWFLMAVGWAVVTKLVQPAVAIAGPWWARPWVAADAIGFYLAKIVWPVSLGIDYGRMPEWLTANRIFWGVAIAIVVGFVVLLVHRREVTAASLLFVLALLPVLGFVAFDFQSQSTVADRYVYVAMLGPAIVVALAAKATPRKMAIGFCLAVVAIWSILSFQQIGAWRDSQTLYLHALKVNPRSLTAAQDVAIVYDKSGDELSAINYYVRAIEIEPRAREEYDNLAMALPRAEKQWPGMSGRWAELHERLAQFYEAIGDPDAARAQRAAADGLGR